MGKLIFAVALALTARLISLLTGRNRRQIEKIPKGMNILCQPPGKRYVMYALGVVVFAVVAFFGMFYIMDGAPEGAGLMWGLCVGLAVLTLIITILCGNIMAKECVYFNHEKIQIEKAFRKPRILLWNEIRKIDGNFDNAVHLYLQDEVKILTVTNGMINYEPFCNMLKRKCPQCVKAYYQTQTYEKTQKCILRYGLEYYVLAVMGILIMLLYVAMIVLSDDKTILEEMLHKGPYQGFSVWFAPVCGVAGIIGLFVFSSTSIRYSREKLILKYPLRRKREIYWRRIQRIEMIQAKQQEENWKKLRIYTQEKVYVVNLSFLTYGKDGFMNELFKMAKIYEIPYAEKRR